MIQIYRDFDSLATDHFNKLEIDLTKKLDGAIKNHSKDVYGIFYKDLKKNLKFLITGKPDKLMSLIVHFNKYKKEPKYNFDLKAIVPEKKKNGEGDEKVDTTLKKELESIFYYKEYDKWKAYELAKELNVNVCPYCNRQYTFTVGNDSKKGTRPEFDHFYDQATYPYLALSFYNLIPSCHICNSALKGSKKFDINKNLHPYIAGVEDSIRFTLIFSSKEEIKVNMKEQNKKLIEEELTKKVDENFGVCFFYGNKESFKIDFKENLKNKPCEKDKNEKFYQNEKVFRLKDLYNQHKDYVYEIVQKSIIYNDSYINDLFNQYNGTLFNSKQDVQRMLLSNYIDENDFHKRPLSKLTRDIAEELGLV